VLTSFSTASGCWWMKSMATAPPRLAPTRVMGRRPSTSFQNPYRHARLASAENELTPSCCGRGWGRGQSRRWDEADTMEKAGKPPTKRPPNGGSGEAIRAQTGEEPKFIERHRVPRARKTCKGTRRTWEKPQPRMSRANVST
jgi:hypothetical protein